MKTGYFKRDLDKKYFLPYTVHVWVSSHKSVNDPKKKFDGSELVIIGTVDSINNFSVKELIEDVSSKIILKMVKFNQLKKLIAAMEGDERVVKERTAKKAEFANLKDEIIALQDKKKKLEALKE